MKRWILALALSLMTLATSSSNYRAEAAETKKTPSGWIEDFNKAKELAKASKKVIFLDFTGSDWCPPCEELSKKIFDTSDFQKFAKDRLILVKVDFPEKKKLPEAQQKANDALAEQFKVDTYPTLILVNEEGKEINRIEAKLGESPKDFLKRLTPLLPEKKH